MNLSKGEARRMVRPRRLDASYAPRIEPLEDRLLLSTCHVKRLADNNGGHDLGNGHLRGTLRYCINHANANPGPDTIDLNVTGTIHLTSHLPHLSSDVTITGPGADLLTLSGDGRIGPIFYIDTATAAVALSGVTVANGVNEGSPGGIVNRGTLMLRDSTVANNENWSGDPNGSGGGIYNFGNMTISGSTISGNAVKYARDVSEGAGIFNRSTGVMLIENSTISGNYFEAGLPYYGGGIYNRGSLEIRFSTITNNNTGPECVNGWGIYNAGATVHLYNTIVSGNKNQNPSCTGHELVGSFTGGANLIGVDAMLGPLQYNGGHTMTHAPLPGSPAIDAGNNADAPEFDQRGPGFPRIVNGTIDIGAFEVQSTPLPSPRATSPTRGFDLLTLFLGTADLDSLTTT